MSKYYKPEIEEFHVGFEYEVEDLGDDGRTRVWRPQVFEGEETRTYFIEELENHEMRVKYLDKSDLESLGFYLQYPDLSSSPFINKDIYKDNACIIDIRSNNMVSITKCNYPNTSTLGFKIKNKSELKKLLKQLGI